MLKWTACQDGPCLIRYPKSGKAIKTDTSCDPFVPGVWQSVSEGDRVLLLAVGSMVSRALETCEILSKHQISAGTVNCSTVKPLDEQFLQRIPKKAAVFTLEEHMLSGGFGEYVTRYCMDHGCAVPVHCFGVRESFIQHGDHERLMRDAGLDASSMAEAIAGMLKGE